MVQLNEILYRNIKQNHMFQTKKHKLASLAFYSLGFLFLQVASTGIVNNIWTRPDIYDDDDDEFMYLWIKNETR